MRGIRRAGPTGHRQSIPPTICCGVRWTCSFRLSAVGAGCLVSAGAPSVLHMCSNLRSRSATFAGRSWILRRILCRECAACKPAYRQLRSWSVFEGPVRNAIHRLKYRRDIGLGEALAPQVAESFAALHWPIELVIPVPLGRKRLAERGYNQVSLIARPLSMLLRIAYSPAALVRQQETRSQVGLSPADRRRNVRGAFQANKFRVDGRIVLLMDDVATTGSTLSSCAEALYAAGARDVFAFSVARALPRHGLRGV